MSKLRRISPTIALLGRPGSFYSLHSKGDVVAVVRNGERPVAAGMSDRLLAGDGTADGVHPFGVIPPLGQAHDELAPPAAADIDGVGFARLRQREHAALEIGRASC